MMLLTKYIREIYLTQMNKLLSILVYRDLLYALTLKEIKIRYKNSYLGYFWSLANPFMLAMIFYFAFQMVAKVPVENYALFLMSGLFVWQWMVNTLTVGSMLFVGNAGLIKKVNFPRNLLGFALVFSESFNFIFSIPVIAAFMWYYNVFPSLAWLWGIPVLFLITAIFLYGIALLIGTLNLFFRDLERLVGLMMTFLLYLTPVLYTVALMPEKLQWLLYVNPFASFVIVWRDMFLSGILNIEFFAIAAVYSFVALALGSFVYHKLKYKFAELI